MATAWPSRAPPSRAHHPATGGVDKGPRATSATVSDTAAIVRCVNWHNLAQYVLSGLSSGGVFALVALGFVLIANVTRVYNFAQGD